MEIFKKWNQWLLLLFLVYLTTTFLRSSNLMLIEMCVEGNLQQKRKNRNIWNATTKEQTEKEKNKTGLLHTSALFFQILFYFTLLVFSPRHELKLRWLFFISFWFLNFWFFSPLLILFGLRWWKKDLGARIYLWPPSSVVYVVYIGFSELLFQLRFTCSIRISLHRCNRFSFPGTFWDFYSFFLDRKYFEILFYFLKFWYSNISRVCNNQSPFLVFVISGDWPAASGRGNY